MSEVRWFRLHAYCPEHSESLVAEWSTFDGRGILLSNLPTCTQERIGFVHDSQNVPGTEEADPHMRLVIRCPRASCNYDLKLAPNQIGILKEFVQDRWAAGETERDVENVEVLIKALNLKARRAGTE